MNRPPIEAMTIEQLREYAALEILGWKKESLPDPFGPDGAVSWDYVAPDYSREVAVESFRPDQDRNQLALVMNALTDWADKQKSDDSNKGWEAVTDAWITALSYPALALEAVCKAHQETK